MPHDIFISYSRRDLAAVKTIKQELEAHGFSCWFDLTGIESGAENFKRIIIPAIHDARVFLFFLSKESQLSTYASKELSFAHAHANKRVVLVRFNDDPLTDEFTFDYGESDIIDWRVPEQREKLLRDLRVWSEGFRGRGADHAGEQDSERCLAISASDEKHRERRRANRGRFAVLASSLFIALLVVTLSSRCISTTRRLDLLHDNSDEVSDLDSRDFSIAAEQMLNDLISSGAVDKPNGGRFVLVVGRVANRTSQNIDVDQLVKKIRIALLRSGKVIVTTAIGADGAEDDMGRVVHDLASHDTFGTSSVYRAGMVIAPDLSLSGKIIERNLKINGYKQRIEYYFQLSLTDINSGLAIWEGEEVIGKVGSR